MGVRCFLIEPTSKDWRYLRRYGHDTAPDGHYHNTMVKIEDGSHTLVAGPDGRKTWRHFAPDGSPESTASGVLIEDRYSRDDPRWPAHCACGYEFRPDDQWQLFHEVVYRRADTGEEMDLRNAPPGAMWDAFWLAEMDSYRGPDGKSLVVKLPNGSEWTIDGPSSQGGHWTRTGEPPNLTATPSILSYACAAWPEYHGWLRDGELASV